MSDIAAILSTILAAYALITGIFLIRENRRPQSTVAWMLAFILIPGVAVAAYLLFGRNRKMFSRERRLLRQDLAGTALPLLAPLLSRQDAEMVRVEKENPEHANLVRLVRRNSVSALTRHNQVDVLQDASAFYPALLADLRAAKRSIYMQYYIWRDDPSTAEFGEVLKAKAQAGIEVRLLYDPIGSLTTLSRRFLREMRAAGVRCAPTSSPFHLHTLAYRNHRKITAIDGEIAYLGGMNIGHEYLHGWSKDDWWRDTQVRIAGEGASVVQSVFMIDWYNAVREDLFTPTHFPAVDPQIGDVPVQILTSGPDSQWAAIRQLYFFMIATAKHHLIIQSPYFVLNASIAEALRSAALSGVKIQVMVCSIGSGEVPVAWASNTYFLDVVEAGVEIYIYRGGNLHAKTISVDGQVCSIGSANVDIRSFNINYEITALLYSRELAGGVEAAFARDLAHCQRFDPRIYRKSNPLLRFRDSVTRLLSPLL